MVPLHLVCVFNVVFLVLYNVSSFVLHSTPHFSSLSFFDAVTNLRNPSYIICTMCAFYSMASCCAPSTVVPLLLDLCAPLFVFMFVHFNFTFIEHPCVHPLFIFLRFPMFSTSVPVCRVFLRPTVFFFALL